VLNVASSPERRPVAAQTRICRHCGEPFDPVWRSQLFCRLSCRLEAERRSQRSLDLLDELPDPGQTSPAATASA
jgi:hypothetical protein